MRACGVALLVLLLPAAALAETVKLAVVIGNNRGQDPGRTLRYAEHDAKKIYDVLTEIGGFERENVDLLIGQPAARVWAAIRRAEQRARSLGGRPDVRTVLFVFYSGHADGNVLELGSSTLSFEKLTGFLRSSGADVRLAFVDSCRSGKLVAAKGGRRAQSFRIQVADEVASRGFALITSSAADELSQESAEIRGSFFTHCLVSALRGAGDTSGDGKVTLDEAYRYTYNRTVARTSASIGGSQHPMYDFKLAGHGGIVLTNTLGGKTALTVNSRGGGRVVVLDSRGDSMIAESSLVAGQPTRLALAPAAYQVYLLQKGSARLARLVLRKGRSVQLAEGDFVQHQLKRGVAKGGLFRGHWGHQLGVGFLLRRLPLGGQGPAMGAAVQYVLQPRSRWQIIGRLRWSTASDLGVSTGYFDLGARLGPYYRLPYGTGAVRVGAVVGYDHMFQDEREGARRDTSAFVYHGAVGVEVPIGSFLLSIDGGVGGQLFRLRDEGIVHRLDVSMLVAAGWRWGSAD
jgi:hypothetical protein